MVFTNSRKSAIGFTPGVFQGVYFEVFISFVHSFGIIIKEKCSPFNQGIIHRGYSSFWSEYEFYFMSEVKNFYIS